MFRVLLVEDDAEIASAVCTQLQKWELQYRQVQDFQQVMGDFDSYQPHLVLLDVMLPFFNGYHWCQEIRRKSAVPILFISSAADSMNMIMAMDMGADDFISKPFDLSVLMAKINALLRRSYELTGTAPILVHHGISLNTGDNSLTINGQFLELSKNEYRIMLCLMENKGQVVSREKLMQALWQSDSFIDDNTLTVNINRLRHKLKAAGLERAIVTKFGVGYLLP
ncbi:response regulator transcription factor [Oscillospiraceae bacterium HV4-5-C5C]|nr:response regulator transcription factor [Oscillospiraceae bacterium HV4-5-C5C]